MKCSYCNKEAVLIAGYNYCSDHLGNYEVRFFEKALSQVFPEEDLIKFFEWAFGIASPKLSDLSKWHSKISRGTWNQQTQSWNLSQDDYIRKIAKEFKNRKG
jgi:hypothetical protein